MRKDRRYHLERRLEGASPRQIVCQGLHSAFRLLDLPWQN
jgi:hypothetical protein